MVTTRAATRSGTAIKIQAAEDLEYIDDRLNTLKAYVDSNNMRDRCKTLRDRTEDHNLWQNIAEAAWVMKEYASLAKFLNSVDKICKGRLRGTVAGEGRVCEGKRLGC